MSGHPVPLAEEYNTFSTACAEQPMSGTPSVSPQTITQPLSPCHNISTQRMHGTAMFTEAIPQ
jgi:hypothetical protein